MQWKKVGITDWNIPKPAKDPVAATYGLSFYSRAFPVAKAKAYRVTVGYKGSGGAKVWVRGYGELNNEKRRIYEAQGDCPNSPAKWGTFSQVFHPTKHTPAVTEMRVMLYAYWPPGVSEFDDVRVEEINEETTK